MDLICSSMHALSILEMPKRPSKYTIHIRVNHYSRTCAVKSTESTSTHQQFDGMPLSADSLVWNSIIQTHLGNFNYCKAVTTYHEMLTRGVRPDRHTLPRILSVSRLSGSLSLGKQLHCQAMKLGVCNDIYVTGCLIELYGHLDGVDAAKWVLDNSARKLSCVSWTLLAKLYIKQNKPALAIDLFNEMVESGAEVDSVSLTTAISACILVKSLIHGRNIHQTAQKQGLELDVLVSNSLLKMYMEFDLFKKVPKIDTDEISYVTALYACCTSRMVENGIQYFNCINSPKVVHFALMAALLSRAGKIDDARAFVKKHNVEKHPEN
ncbi:hypothetical protein L1887_02712 [Cichorium endivia]|nr:hypothetical protein L1887_02712 [Cichorium endivia]